MLFGYHHSGDRKNIPVGRHRRKMMGVELEFVPVATKKFFAGTFKGAGNLLAAYLEKTLCESGINPNWFVFETDGSLEAPEGMMGVEMISRPVSYRGLKQLPWDKFFEALRKENLVNLGHESCGMHVHVDTPSLPEGWKHFRMMWHRLSTMSDRQFHHLFGRYPNSYCRTFPSVELYRILGTDDDGDLIEEYVNEEYSPEMWHNALVGNADFREYAEDRYSPINLASQDTVEFRMFASPSSGAQFLRALEFVNKFGYPTKEVVDATIDYNRVGNSDLFIP